MIVPFKLKYKSNKFMFKYLHNEGKIVI